MRAGGSERPGVRSAETMCADTLSPQAGNSLPGSDPGAEPGTLRTASHRNSTFVGGGPIPAMHQPPIRADGAGRSAGSHAVEC